DRDRRERVRTMERDVPLPDEQVLERKRVARLVERSGREEEGTNDPPLLPFAVRAPDHLELGDAEHREDEGDVHVGMGLPEFAGRRAPVERRRQEPVPDDPSRRQDRFPGRFNGIELPLPHAPRSPVEPSLEAAARAAPTARPTTEAAEASPASAAAETTTPSSAEPAAESSEPAPRAARSGAAASGPFAEPAPPTHHAVVRDGDEDEEYEEQEQKRPT